MLFLPKIDATTQRYDISKSYEWNYENAPPLPDNYVVSPPDRQWTLCGAPVNSPIGIAAGPLLNGRWVLHYASLGFDVLTYKTVRTRARDCYGLPNLQPIERVAVSEPPPSPIATSATMQESWAVSFGMPSASPDLWRFDVEETRRLLPSQKRLSVSVVATPEPGWTLEQLAEDYAKAARWAVDSGADFVELNFSCPNVSTSDGQLYQNPKSAAEVASVVRQRIGRTPLLLKIGYVPTEVDANALVGSVGDIVDGLVMINCIPATVADDTGLLFNGEPRGIAGPAIRSAVLQQLTTFRSAVSATGCSVDLVGVGGINSVEDAEACLTAGAAGVQIATAAMRYAAQR